MSPILVLLFVPSGIQFTVGILTCPVYNQLIKDGSVLPSYFFFVRFWDKEQSLLDPYPLKYVQTTYNKFSGLALKITTVIAANQCDSDLTLYYNFYLDYSPVYEDRCSLHRTFPPRYRLRFSDDGKIGVLIGCTEQKSKIHYEVLVISQQTHLLTPDHEFLSFARQLLESEGIAEVQLQPTFLPSHTNWTRTSNAPDCNLKCSNPNINMGEKIRQKKPLGEFGKASVVAKATPLKDYTNTKIGIVAILALCVIYMYMRKRLHQRNRIHVSGE